METSLVLLYGIGALVAIIILGIFFSKRNESRKSKESTPIELPEKEYSQYNVDEIKEGVVCCDEDEMSSEDKTIMCTRCGRVEATDNYDDKPVCEDCFEELDENGEYYDFDNSESSSSSGGGIDLTNLAIGIVVLGIVVSISATILIEMSDTFKSGAFNTTGMNAMNSTTASIESFTFFGDWFDIIVIVGVAAVILAIVFQAFRFTKIGDL